MLDTRILIAAVLILFLCCFIEFAMLLKDRGRFANLLARAKSSIRERGFVRTFLHSFTFLFRKLWQIVSIKNMRDNSIKICFLFEGGYGDFLICANFFEHFKNKFAHDYVHFFLYGTGGLKDIFNYEVPNVTVLDRKDFDFDFSKYDIGFKIAKRNQLMYADKERLKELSPDLYEYVLLCEKYMEENRILFDMNPRLDGLNSAISIAQGKKRIQEADIYGFLGVTEEFKYTLLIKEDEGAYLQSLGLEPKKFILVHRGWDATYNMGEHVKAWSLQSCGDIIPQLKKRFSDYKIILFGVDRTQAPLADGVDLDLIGKTTLNQAKVLLKHAAVLIDNEGGMVHLRHALHGGSSVILFGPTSEKLFGYSENINLTSTVCSHWCEWLSSDWQYTCAMTGKNGHPCMDAITTADILDAVDKIVQSTLFGDFSGQEPKVEKNNDLQYRIY